MLWTTRRGRDAASGCGLLDLRVAARDAPIAPLRPSRVPAAWLCALRWGRARGRVLCAWAMRGGAVSAQRAVRLRVRGVRLGDRRHGNGCPPRLGGSSVQRRRCVSGLRGALSSPPPLCSVHSLPEGLNPGGAWPQGYHCFPVYIHSICTLIDSANTCVVPNLSLALL